MAVVLQVVRQLDCRHPAGTEFALDLVAACKGGVELRVMSIVGESLGTSSLSDGRQPITKAVLHSLPSQVAAPRRREEPPIDDSAAC